MNSLTTQPLKPSFLDENQPVVNIHNLDHFFGTGSLKKQILFQINIVLPDWLQYANNVNLFYF